MNWVLIHSFKNPAPSVADFDVHLRSKNRKQQKNKRERQGINDEWRPQVGAQVKLMCILSSNQKDPIFAFLQATFLIFVFLISPGDNIRLWHSAFSLPGNGFF
ncbi:hypothetical protein NE237_021551 [Protea cynaroides]|uniref:Uncharacterized protein n=1 Tax=Protea cynaroides TaxID=273540 RepID=A0A9Q0H809_9MAGN|nr:hypothetical protein NE237_021551 [Protea cynaroides]